MKKQILSQLKKQKTNKKKKMNKKNYKIKR